MATNNANLTNRAGTDATENEATSKGWDNLPLELRGMIMSQLSYQDLRKAFFTCRPVSRSFKEAVEFVFRSRFAADLRFNMRLRYLTLVSGYPRSTETGETNMGWKTSAATWPLRFHSFSEDKTQISLGDLENPTIVSLHGREISPRSAEGVCAFSHHFQRWPSKFLCHISRKEEYEDFTTDEEDVREKEDCPKPYITHSGISHEFPFLPPGTFKLDPEKPEFTMSWAHIVGGLLVRELRIAEYLMDMARRDVESRASPWRLESNNPSAEQGLRIALRSEIVRRARFENCFYDARYLFFRYSSYRPPRSQWYTYFGEGGGSRFDWYDEWATYVGIVR